MCYNNSIILDSGKDGIGLVVRVLIGVAVVIVSYLINPIIGAVVTGIGVLAAVYFLLPNIFALKGSRAFADGNLEKAQVWYKRAIGTGRASDNLKNMYGFLLIRAGKLSQAQTQLDQVARKKTAKPQDKLRAKQYRCLVYCKQGDMESAMEDAQELYAENKNTMTYGIMGYFMLLTKAPIEDTIRICEEAYEYNSDDRDILDNLALAYIRAEKFDKAKELTARLMEENPQFVEAFYHGALVEYKLGDKKAALSHLDRIKDCKRSYMTTVSEEEIEQLRREVEENA